MNDAMLADSFEKSLKPRAIEEFLDYYFYRRVAYRMVPVLHRLGISPNQVTTISLLLGLAGGVAVLYRHFVLSGALCLLAIFFDCCDGQLARLTGKSSPLGRAMDGTFDLIWIFSYWWMVYFSTYLQDSGYTDVLGFMLAGGASMVVHCWRFDGVKIQVLELAGAKFSEGDMDIHQARQCLKEEWGRFNLLAVLLILCLMFQMYFFVRGKAQKKTLQRTPEETERITRHFDPVLSAWSWLGEGHHNSLIILGVLLAPLTPHVLVAAIWTILVPMNLWWLYCEWQFHRAKRTLPV